MNDCTCIHVVTAPVTVAVTEQWSLLWGPHHSINQFVRRTHNTFQQNNVGLGLHSSTMERRVVGPPKKQMLRLWATQYKEQLKHKVQYN